MSVRGKIWNIKYTSSDIPTLKKLLINRNIDSTEKKINFLKADFDSENHDPFLFRDMQKAISRTMQAIESGERIMVFGDYDVDGISGAAILVHVLRSHGAEVSYRLPHRVKDGYGLNMRFIDEFIEAQVGLVVTVDCGISCADQIQKASDNNIDVIVTDHHTIPANFPESAYAVIHPLSRTDRYPFRHLTGAGVALKFAQALLKHTKIEKSEEIEKLLITFASLGTVADLGHLSGENRTIVRRGLDLMKDCQWLGLKSLMKQAGIKDGEEISAFNIGYQLAPRINAAGRIGSPYIACQLLLNNSSEAQKMAEELDQLNRKRQLMTQQALEHAEKMIADQLQNERLLIVYSDQWHAGILGLLAGKIAEKHYRPTIVMEEREHCLVGSARSPEAFDIVQALTQQKDLLSHFGGHTQAAGFELPKENRDVFIEAIQAYARNILEKSEIKPSLDIDCEIDIHEIDHDLYQEIKGLSPFGMGNEEPVFLLKGVSPQFPKKVGSTQNHLKFAFEKDGKRCNAIGFNLGDYFDYLIEKQSIDVVCTIDVNQWNGKEFLQAKVIDFD